MKALFKLALSVTILISLNSCSSDEDPQPSNLSASDLSVTVDEGVSTGQVLGTIVASTDGGALSFEIVDGNPNGAIAVGSTTGQVTVANGSVFVFADNPQISATVEVTDGIESLRITITISINEPDSDPTNFNVWTGSAITFTKEDDTDPTLEANQDRLTDNVWITRDPNGGQIYNAAVETWSVALQDTAPADTEWALGTTADIANLEFSSFRNTIAPKDVVGQDLVLHLITDGIYIDIKFTAWSRGGQSGGRGGFAYERSTEE